MSWESTPDYHYSTDGHVLIRKTCWHCGEKYAVHVLAQASLTNYCDACRFVQQQEAMAYLKDKTKPKVSPMPSFEPVKRSNGVFRRWLWFAGVVAACVVLILVVKEYR